MTSKWFYKHQAEIEKHIEANGYSRSGYCLYQEVTKDRYFECWELVNNKTGDYVNVLFVVNRLTGFLSTYQYKHL